MRPPTSRLDCRLLCPVLIAETYAAQHQAVIRCGGKRQDQRVLLQAANPYGIQPLIEDAERRKKTPQGNGKVRVGDVVRLEIVEILAHLAAVSATPVRTLKCSLELHSPFHQPVVTEWQKKNWIDLSVDLILSRGDEIKIPGTAAENGDGLLGIGRLCGRLAGHKRWKTQGGNHR